MAESDDVFEDHGPVGVGTLAGWSAKCWMDSAGSGIQKPHGPHLWQDRGDAELAYCKGYVATPPVTRVTAEEWDAHLSRKEAAEDGPCREECWDEEGNKHA